MKHILLFVCLLVPGAAFAETLEVGKYAKVFTGPEGLTVTFVPLKSKDGALIEISGVETEIDGIVMRYEKVTTGRDARMWKTTLHGEGYNTFHDRPYRWGDARDYKIYLPERPVKGISVRFDEKKTKEVKALHVLTAYQKKANQDAIKKLAAWNRAEREARHDKEFSAAAQDFESKCGFKIPAKINWKTVSDDHLKKYSIYSFCEEPLERLARRCKDGQAKAVKSKIKSYECSFAPKIKLRLDKGKVSFKVDPEASNQGDFVKAFLTNEL